MHRPLKLLKVLVISWIALVVALPATTGMVLCIGNDGHFKIEPAHEGHCAATPDTHEQDGRPLGKLQVSTVADTGSDCVDVSLSSDTIMYAPQGPRLRIATRLDFNRALTVVSAGAIIASARDCVPPGTPYGRTPPLCPSPALHPLRTIVLQV